MEQFYEEYGAEILEIAQVISERLGSNPENAKKILDMTSSMIDTLAFDPFDGGKTFYRTTDERHSLIHSPQGNGVIKPFLAETKNVVKADLAAEALLRENRRTENKKINAVSGILPNNGKISVLWHLAEGELVDDDLISPTYEGGHLYLLLLRECNLPIKIDNEEIQDVAMPPTLFLVRTIKITETSEVGGTTVENEAIKVTRVYAACLDSTGIVDENSKVYDWPWCNASTTQHGWMCLGNNYASGSLVFPGISSLILLPHYVISKFPITGHYGASLMDYTYATLKEFAKSIQGKTFPKKQLKYRYVLSEWIKNVVKDLYRKDF